MCAQGERYMGHWHMGKKSGYGRYIFENGDIYDGDWLRDLAHGKGFYRCVMMLSRSLHDDLILG